MLPWQMCDSNGLQVEGTTTYVEIEMTKCSSLLIRNCVQPKFYQIPSLNVNTINETVHVHWQILWENILAHLQANTQ